MRTAATGAVVFFSRMTEKPLVILKTRRVASLTRRASMVAGATKSPEPLADAGARLVGWLASAGINVSNGCCVELHAAIRKADAAPNHDSVRRVMNDSSKWMLEA